MSQSRLRLSGKDQLSLFTDLSTMLSAGIPILDTIESLEPDAKGNLKLVLGELRRALTNGETLARAMARFPKAFDPVTVNLIKAAESGGTLEDTLKDIVSGLKKQLAFSSDLKTAMIYPAFVMTIFTGILIMLLTFVIPRLAKVFQSTHANIPWTTRQVIKASDFFVAHWVFIVIGIVLFIVLAIVVVVNYKRTIIRLILGLPGLRRLGITMDLARLTRSLALLLKAGVPLEEALVMGKRSVRKKEIIEVVEDMQRSMAAGKPLSSSLRDTGGVVPVMMARSVETAESSGTLEPTMQSLAEHFDLQASQSVKTISSLVEPIMILVVGGMVGFIMLTVIAPIYGMTSKLKPGSV